MFKKMIAAAAVSMVALAGPALASSNGPLPYEKWDNSVRSMFFNEDLSIRADQDIRDGWQKMTPEQQATVRTDCKTAFPAAGSSDLTNTNSAVTDNPVPGAADQAHVCSMVESM